MAGRAAVEGSSARGQTWALDRGAAGYPAQLTTHLGKGAPQSLSFLGARQIWFEPQAPSLGLVASVRCPGEVILATYDLALALRQAGVHLIGGFHSPMEQEALWLLMRGQQPVVVCPARSLHGMRIKREYREPIAQGRLLLVSPFADSVRHATEETATLRNRIVAAVADALLIVHAQPGGKTEALAREALAWGKNVQTLELPSNRNLFTLGARVFDLKNWLRIT